MTQYTSTVRVPQQRSQSWQRLRDSVLYAIGLPFLLLLLWGVWATVAPATGGLSGWNAVRTAGSLVSTPAAEPSDA